MKNINHWLEGKRWQYQSGKYFEEKIKYAYESYLNDSLNCSSSSQKLNPSVKRWKEIPKTKVEGHRIVDGKRKVNVEPITLNDYILMPKSIKISLIDSLKSKVSIGY